MTGDAGAPAVGVGTNRLLLARRGWDDCVQVQCAISISRSIGVTGAGGGVGSDVEIIALLPYRLPGDATLQRRPTLTIASHPHIDGHTQAWTKLPNGSLRQQWKIFRCNDPSGCFLASYPPAKGPPAVARTARFPVKP